MSGEQEAYDAKLQAVDGGPAFPSEGEGHGNPHYHSPGMSLRDYFAGQALAGHMASLNPCAEIDPDTAEALARSSYGVADAMLAEGGK